MKIADIITSVDGIKPNEFTNDQKVLWISTLEGRLQTEIWLRGPDEKLLSYSGYTASSDIEPLARDGYADMYIQYLAAMIDFWHGEYSKYQNTMKTFNSTWLDYQRWVVRTYNPAYADHSPVTLGTVTFSQESGTAVLLATLEPGDILFSVSCTVTAAFDSGDGDVLILGTAADPDALLAASDITEETAGIYEKAICLRAGSSDLGIYATLTKSGTPATAGSATFTARVLGKAVS